jgi:hypothetical protein
LIVGIIALGEVNLGWLKLLSGRYRCLLVVQEPGSMDFQSHAESYFVVPHRLGLGGARRLSMLLCGELEPLCIVTDGDGQYPLESIVKFAHALSTTEDEVLIGQRKNRVLWIDKEGSLLDRREFEKFENHCALRYLDRPDLPVTTDLQPGLFGFRSSVLGKILPDDRGWLADWQISINAIRRTKFGLVEVGTDPVVQQTTTITLKDEAAKLRRIQAMIGVSLSDIFDDYRENIEPREAVALKEIIDDLDR